MKSRSQHTDVPEFLHNSPFFLPELHEFKADRRIKKQPALSEILKSKPFRPVIYVIVAIIMLLYFKHKAQQVHLWDHLTGPSCYYTKPVLPPFHYGTNETDWSKFAYALYATDTEYLCNTVMLFEILHRMGSRADRILLYARDFSLDSKSESLNTELLLKAKHEYGVKLIPIDVQHNNLAFYSGPNWSDSYTKLLAFNQTMYERLIVLDSDSTMFEPMDELFFLPSTRTALSRAYWLPKPSMSSHIMLIEPSISSFALIQTAIAAAGYGVYDMEIINRLFGSSKDCIRLPHRTYALLTGEFRKNEHAHGRYLDDDATVWSSDAAIMEAKFVHFSDHPMQKPWLVNKDKEGKYGYEPACVHTDDTNPENKGLDCTAKNIWVDLLDDFKERRMRVCGI